ncbi:MAG: hypothetical protein ACRDCE_01535 [Cetobacterium sp.]|uniref:hypothetical protein n=1 Tax=Cetobacterium sp. TaxID=2071632 RepID=UPI003EE5FB12
MLKLSESEQLSKDLFVKVSGDDGFNDDQVFDTIHAVMCNRKISKSQRIVWSERLTDAGLSFIVSYCEAYCKGGMWKALMVIHKHA